MHISQNAGIHPSNTLWVQVLSVCVFSSSQAGQRLKTSLASTWWAKMLSGNFRKCQQRSLPVLYPYCTQAGVLCERLEGGGRGSWGGLERVQNQLQWTSTWHLSPRRGYNGRSPITVCWGTGAWLTRRNPQSPPACLSACLPLPPWSARRNMLPSQTLPDEKQIPRREPHYLTGCKWLWEFKVVIHVPPKPRLGQL